MGSNRLLAIALVLLANVAFAQVPATPSCTRPINNDWEPDYVTFRMSAYSGTLAQTGSQWQVTTTAGNYATPVLDVTTGVTNQIARGQIFTNDTAYYWRGRYENSAGFSAWCAEQTFRVDTVDPSVPGVPNVTATDAGGYNISFTGSTDTPSGIFQYEVYERYDGGNVSYSFTLTNPSTANRYYGPGTWELRSRSVDNARNFSNLSGPAASFTVLPDPTVEVPLQPTVTPPYVPANVSFDISWPDAGTNRYILGRRFNILSITNRKTVTNSLATSDLQSNEGAWEFRIAAISPEGAVSEWSPWSSTAYRDVTDPTAPTGLTVTPLLTNGALLVSWDAGTDATSGIGSYEVQRRPTGTTNWTTVATVAGMAASDTPPQGSFNYRVRAEDRAGNQSFFTPNSPQVIADLSAPSGVVVTAGPVTTSGNVSITWTVATDPGLAALAPYRVQRGPPDAGAWTDVGSTTATQLADVLTEPIAVYRVISSDTAGNSTESPPSNEVLLTGRALGADCVQAANCGSGFCAASRCCVADCVLGCDTDGVCVAPVIDAGTEPEPEPQPEAEPELRTLRVGCDAGGSAPLFLLSLAVGYSLIRGASSSRSTIGARSGTSAVGAGATSGRRPNASSSSG